MMRAEIVFTFRDTHNAMNGEKALLSSGMEVRVMPRPSALGEGCGICLRVAPEERARAEALLRDGGAAVEGVFSKTRVEGETRYESLPPLVSLA